MPETLQGLIVQEFLFLPELDLINEQKQALLIAVVDLWIRLNTQATVRVGSLASLSKVQERAVLGKCFLHLVVLTFA